MKITWLGQAGLLIEAAGKKIIVDPYLSDSVAKVNPKNYRRLPIDESFLRIIPDFLLLTHNHLDHTDPETLPAYLAVGGSVTVLAPDSAWAEARKFGGEHNYVSFNRHTEWSKGDIRFIAVRAEHSDKSPVPFPQARDFTPALTTTKCSDFAPPITFSPTSHTQAV